MVVELQHIKCSVFCRSGSREVRNTGCQEARAGSGSATTNGHDL